MTEKKPEIFLITGEVNSGKSTYLYDIFQQYKDRSPSGIIAPGVFDNGVKTGYDVIDLATGERKRLAVSSPPEEAYFKVGRYYFLKKSFEFAKEALTALKPDGIVFIDEIGPLELAGEGYCNCVHEIAKSGAEAAYAAVRSVCINEAVKKFFSANKVSLKTTGVDK